MFDEGAHRRNVKASKKKVNIVQAPIKHQPYFFANRPDAKKVKSLRKGTRETQMHSFYSIQEQQNCMQLRKMNIK